ELGFSKPYGKWSVELVGSATFFMANNNFFGGVKRQQKPLGFVQAHLVYTIKRRMWAAVNVGYYTGGRTVVNSIINADRQANSRAGATFSFPLNQRQSIKVAYAKGVTTRFGGDLATIAVAWQYAWLK